MKPKSCFTISIKIVFISKLIFESSYDIRVVEIHVLYASGEVFKDQKTFLDIWHASNVEVPVKIELHEVPKDAVSYTHSVDRHDHVTPFPGYHHLMECVIVQKRAKGHGSLFLGSKVDVENQSEKASEIQSGSLDFSF